MKNLVKGAVISLALIGSSFAFATTASARDHSSVGVVVSTPGVSFSYNNGSYYDRYHHRHYYRYPSDWQRYHHSREWYRYHTRWDDRHHRDWYRGRRY